MKKWLLGMMVFLLIGAVGLLSVLLLLFHSNRVIDQMQAKIYPLETIPARKVGLLLGAAKITPNGVPNLYFAERITAAAELYHAGKITHILISGDNSRKGYDEANDMKAALLERQVPAEAMTLDFAGFRTLDSVVRAKVVFGCSELTIITQPGHLERALYIAAKHDIDAIGYAAKEPALPWLRKRNRKREIAAKAAAWLDVNLLRRQPKFLGPQVPISEPIRQKPTELPINIVQYDVAGSNARAEVWCGGEKVFECKTRHALGIMKPLDAEPHNGHQRFSFDWAYRQKGSDYRDCVVDLTGDGDKRYLILVDAGPGNTGPEIGYLLDVKDNFKLLGKIPVGETYDYPMPNPDLVMSFYDVIAYFGAGGWAEIHATLKLGGGEPVCVSERAKSLPVLKKITETDPEIRMQSLICLYCELASAGRLQHAESIALHSGFTPEEIQSEGGETVQRIRTSELWQFLGPLNQMK